MTRLKLDVDRLAVESFAAVDSPPAPAARGAMSPLCGPSLMDTCETQC